MKPWRWVLPPLLFFALAAPASAQDCRQSVINGMTDGTVIFVGIQHHEVVKVFEESISPGQIMSWRVPCGDPVPVQVTLFRDGDPKDNITKELVVPPEGMTNAWCIGGMCEEIKKFLGKGRTGGVRLRIGE